MNYVSFEQIARHKLKVKYPNDYHNGWNDAIDEILECQPADVAEVKYAKWVKNENGYIHCTECLSPILLDGAEEYVYSPYCPYCGAKMDEVEK